MIFFTFNDLPNGIYKSQVIDVIKLLRSKFDLKIRLIAFIPLRTYSDGKSKIKQWDENALVIPMLPRMKSWQLNRFIFALVNQIIPSEKIIARGPFATWIALKNKRKNQRICYDGRAAAFAEAEEYDVMSDPALTRQLKEIEKEVIHQADFRIAVSNKLIEYWQSFYGYNKEGHVVIPCTLSDDLGSVDEQKTAQLAGKLGWKADDLIFIYSGSNQKWQSFDLVRDMLIYYLERIPSVRILFLAPSDEVIDEFVRQHPTKTKRLWVSHHEVKDYLSLGSYGILVRERTITNKVASPVKFAEYLSAGLKVLCSPDLGDYSALIEEHNLGYIVTEKNFGEFIPTNVSRQEKERIKEIGFHYFSKKSERVTALYRQLAERFLKEKSIQD